MGVSVELRSVPGPFQQNVRMVQAEARDSRHPDLLGCFTYVLLQMDGGPGQPGIQGGTFAISLWGVEVRRPGTLYPITATEELTTARIRDLPLHTWDTAARQFLVEAAGTDSFRAAMNDTTKAHVIAGPPSYLTDPDMLDVYAENLMLSMYPDVDKDDSPAGLRRLRTLRRLAEVAVEYQRYLMEGRTDPAAEIARQHDVKPATARSWIHRARAARLLTQPTAFKAGTAAD